MSNDTPNLQDSVRESMRVYFNELDGTDPTNLHDMLVT